MELQPPPNVSELARSLGVNRVTLYQWFNKGCPRDSVESVAAWRLQNVRSDRLEHTKRAEIEEMLTAKTQDDVLAPDSPDTPTEPVKRVRRKLTLADRRLKADTAKIRAEVAYKRMRNQEKRRDLVSLASVNREAAELAIRIKERLTAAPDEFETRFPAETRAANKADFEDFVRILLLEISTWRVLDTGMDERIVAAAAAIEAARDKKHVV